MIKTETAIQGTTPVDSKKAHKLMVSQLYILALVRQSGYQLMLSQDNDG